MGKELHLKYNTETNKKDVPEANQPSKSAKVIMPMGFAGFGRVKSKKMSSTDKSVHNAPPRKEAPVVEAVIEYEAMGENQPITTIDETSQRLAIVSGKRPASHIDLEASDLGGRDERRQ